MALTREQVRDRIAQRILREYTDNVTPAQVLQALQNMPAQERNQLVGAVRTGNARRIGQGILLAVRNELVNLATVDADGILADDALSLAEIERVFL